MIAQNILLLVCPLAQHGAVEQKDESGRPRLNREIQSLQTLWSSCDGKSTLELSLPCHSSICSRGKKEAEGGGIRKNEKSRRKQEQKRK